MKEISKNIRTHIVILRDWRSFNITRWQYEAIKEWKRNQKRNDPFSLYDCDTGKLLFDWEIGEIKEFKEKNIDKDYAGKVYVCDFWWRHCLSCDCDCEFEFWCLSFQFQDRLGKMWYVINNSSDITKEMRTAYKQKYL